MAGEPVVRWCNGGSSGSWADLRPAPYINRGFEETGRFLFETAAVDFDLRIDDATLNRPDDSSARWEWTPGFFAGQVVAELVTPLAGVAATYLLDVSPDPRKLGGQMFERMVDELLRAAPALVFGEEPATIMTGELGEFQDPWLEFARLRRYGPEFMRAIAPIQREPRRSLRVRRDSASLHHVRRVDRRTVVSLLRSPALALTLAQADDLPQASAETRLDVPAIEETVDSAANRAMLALVQGLMRRARTLQEVLEARAQAAADSETRTSVALRWPVRRNFLQTFESQLKVVMRRPPFSDVTRAETSAAGLNAIAADPLYSRAWSRGWRALRHGAGGDGDERLWISPTWEVYERWCFLRLGRLLEAECSSWNWQLDAATARWTGRAGGRRAELALQPKFMSFPPNRSRRWSVSRERVPDIVVFLSADAEADETRFVVLDAKYRVSRAAVLDAMQSAHIYQDSLRVGDARPFATLLLVPAAGGAPWLEQEAFQSEHRVGVWCLSPDQPQALPGFLWSLLQTSSSHPESS